MLRLKPLTRLSVDSYLIAFGQPAGHREVAPREFDVHSRWKPEREAEEKRRRRREEEEETKTEP